VEKRLERNPKYTVANFLTPFVLFWIVLLMAIKGSMGSVAWIAFLHYMVKVEKLVLGRQ
jgi:hypothetical protein